MAIDTVCNSVVDPTLLPKVFFMSVHVHNIEREFTPSEAEAVTGVTVTLQRDWRRRGLLPESGPGKWTKFTLSDVIRMSVMKLVSDAGISIKSNDDLAQMAVLPTLAFLEQIPGAVELEGDEVSDTLRLSIETAGTVRGGHGRFLVSFPNLPEWKRVGRYTSLKQVEQVLEDRGCACFVTVDLRSLAERIFVRAKGSLIRREIEVTQ